MMLQFRFFMSLTLSPESLRVITKAVTVVWCRVFWFRIAKIASLVARFTPLLAPFG